MKLLFIESKKKFFQSVPNLDFLPEKIGLLYSVQYKPLFEKIKVELEKNKKKVFVGKSSLNEGQILGCNIQSALSIESKVDCFLLVSSGKFHALSLMLNAKKPLYILGDKIERIGEKEIESLKKKRKAALSKFLLANRIGIIASTKQGQQNMIEAIKLKKQLKAEHKEAFVFISDNINTAEFENFKIDFWVNTACPGIIFDVPNMINISELKTIIKV
jgi:2-(3-amino-3-carboxypropyl)histidine synthase